MIKLKAVGHRILVKVDATPEKKGSILLPEETKRLDKLMINKGTVLSVGPTAFLNKERFGPEPWCKEGDRILFVPAGEIQIQPDGTLLRLINDLDVYALVSEEEDEVEQDLVINS